ncbi:MAG: alpha/beta fold hydrolase [Myxococcota bacterium]
MRFRTLTFCSVVFLACDSSSDGGVADTAVDPDVAADTATVDDATADATSAPDAEVVDDVGVADVADIADVATGPLPDVTVTWEACDELQHEPHDNVDCAVVPMPLDWEHPERGSIDIWVKRLRSADTGTPRRALWLLMGGPGQAGSDGESLAALLAERDPGLDFYLPDHRGTGKSTQLVCPIQQGSLSQGGPNITAHEWPACRDALVGKWGDGLAHFSTTGAAHDTAALIGAIHAPEDQVVVLGISYGTYLANRYLEVAGRHAGGLADGVVLDSICAGDHCLLSLEDVWEDGTAQEILSHCPEDPECASRFPGRTGAWDALGTLYDKIAAGHCPIAGDPDSDRELLRTAMGNLMFGFAGRRATAAFIHRYLRCDADDVTAIRFLYTRLFGYDPGAASFELPPPSAFAPGGHEGFSFPLQVNILASELWEPEDPGPDELLARWEATRSCRGTGKAAAFEVPGWPRYHDPLAGTLAESDVPLLALNADLDTATPARYARPLGQHFTAPHQRYIEIVGGAHSLMTQGQLMSDPTSTCGRELLLQFVQDPKAELDTACLADTLPLGFHFRVEATRFFFGTDDLYGDPPQ